jgi:hypothetical protein
MKLPALREQPPHSSLSPMGRGLRRVGEAKPSLTQSWVRGTTPALNGIGELALFLAKQSCGTDHTVIPELMLSRDRGRRIVNSVNSPGWLSTSIEPPCCWVTMSQLIESPSPVPSPVGLVVKNG